MVFTFLASCQDIDPIEKPDNLIAEDTMKDIMYDGLLLNSARGYNIGLLNNAGINPETFVLEKYAIDSIQYAQNIAYYASDVENFQKMNREIAERVEFLRIEKDSIYNLEIAERDSLRKLFQREKSAVLTPEDSLKMVEGNKKLMMMDTTTMNRKRFSKPLKFKPDSKNE